MCYHDTTHDHKETRNGWLYRIFCPKCGVSTGWKKTVELAIMAWESIRW